MLLPFVKGGWGDLQPQSSHQLLGRDRCSRQTFGVLAGQVLGGFDHVAGSGPGGDVGVGTLGQEALGEHRAQGLQNVDGDVVGAKLEGQAPGEPFQTDLGRTVVLADEDDVLAVGRQRG